VHSANVYAYRAGTRQATAVLGVPAFHRLQVIFSLSVVIDSLDTAYRYDSVLRIFSTTSIYTPVRQVPLCAASQTQPSQSAVVSAICYNKE
jgi:hypothetical protein